MFEEDLVRHVSGLVLALVAFGAVGFGAWSLRRRFLPSWGGAPAALVDIVVALTLIVAVVEVLGTIGLFRLVPVALGLTLTGGTCWWATHRAVPDERPVAAPDDGPRLPPYRLGRVPQAFAAVSVLIVVAEWGARTAWALQHGMQTVDTLWYHLPVAARWVQDGTIVPLHFLEDEPLTTFFPANGSIFHALGMLFTGSDVLSPILNLGWLALALLAAWVLGQAFGAAPLVAGAAAVALATPMALATQPGGGYSDTMGIALLLASLALLVTASVGGRAPVIAEVVVAAAASGLAFGTKFQMIVPVGAVALAAVALAPAGQRVRRTLWWGGTLVVTGGFWYLRNLFAVGNPLPSMSIEIGPLSLPSPPIRTEFSTVASHAFDDGVWSDTYWPGFDQGLGGLWWLLLGAVALGLVGAALKGPLARAVAFVAGLTLVGFVVSPAILGYGDDLIYFDAVVRYLLPGLVLGAVTLAVAAAAWGTRWAWVAVGVLSVALMAIQVDQSDWTEPIEQGFDTMIWEREALTALVLSAVGLALLAAVAAGLRRADRRGRLAIVAGLAALLVLASIPVRDRYLDGRYVDGVGIVRVLGLDWTEGLHDERIGFTGGPTQYPLYGPDLSNHVQYIGVEGDHGAWDRPQTCEAWRQAVNDGDYTLVVASERAFVPEPDVEMTWTGSDPNAVVVDEVGSTVIYRINGPLDPATCPGAAPDDPAEPTT